ncbi:lasso peptide biosynthesis PqqD family chaperone [Nonomuraea candida]|uniref:lasso peptide biosynthesis PqqD family chaperone n=1 Tax=Nonomuraea candida TaxID=359159 RepID=UPI0005B947AA|nr:lasso peptide biosynthesis PqqD family chaperone [Nonomuraea candida]
MTTFSIKDGISRVRTDYGDVLLDETEGRYWHANRAAGLVLDVVEQGGGAEQAAERLVAEFGIDGGTARTDAETLLRHLRDLGMLR